MKVFVDECVNRKLLTHLSGRHSFIHATDTSLASMKNGALLSLIAPDYDAFLTIDRNIPYQQNLSKFDLAFIILKAVSNKLDDILPLAPHIILTLDTIKSGDVVLIAE